MRDLFEDPPRWRENSDQNDVVERIIGQDLRAIRTPALLSEAQMARIAARTRPSRVLHTRRWLALAAALALGAATAAWATHLHLLPRWLTGATAPHPEETQRNGRNHRTDHRNTLPATLSPSVFEPMPGPHDHNLAQATASSRADTQPTIAPPSVSAAPAAAPRRTFLPVSAPRPVGQLDRPSTDGVTSPVLVSPPPPASQPQPALRNEPVAPSAAAVASPPAGSESPPSHAPTLRASPIAMLDPRKPPSRDRVQEVSKPPGDAEVSTLLAHAIRLLRAEGRPQAALAWLDVHTARLGQSPYRHEALLIRVEALLALKRDAELLRLLDGEALADVAASRTLLTTRGRLRAVAKRCPEAMADFDLVLGESGGKDRQALLGRAFCRAAMGNRQGAKVDGQGHRSAAE
jgi:hypothetical protein